MESTSFVMEKDFYHPSIMHNEVEIRHTEKWMRKASHIIKSMPHPLTQPAWEERFDEHYGNVTDSNGYVQVNLKKMKDFHHQELDRERETLLDEVEKQVIGEINNVEEVDKIKLFIMEKLPKHAVRLVQMIEVSNSQRDYMIKNQLDKLTALRKGI